MVGEPVAEAGIEVDRALHTPGELVMPIYMNYNALAVAGDVTAEGHETWIEVNKFQWGFGRGISSPTGGSADRESSAPSISEITIFKDMDKASIKLIDEGLQGEGVTVVLDFCKTDKGSLEVYAKYTLEDCMISGYSTSSGGDKPTESLSLNFTKVTVTYSPQSDTGGSGQPEHVIYNLATAKVG